MQEVQQVGYMLANGCDSETITPDEILRRTSFWNQGQQRKIVQKVESYVDRYQCDLPHQEYASTNESGR